MATKAIPSIVQALATIISDSKSDHFKQKCCKMFEVYMCVCVWGGGGGWLGVLVTLNCSYSRLKSTIQLLDFESISAGP